MDGGEAVQFQLALRRGSFGDKEQEAARYGALRASIFRSDAAGPAARSIEGSAE